MSHYTTFLSRFFSLGVFLLGLVFAASTAYAQADPTLPYQGYLTDTDGNPLDGSVDLTFRIYPTAQGSISLWGESQENVSLSEGIFSVMLGSGASLDNVDFSVARYLGISVNGGDELEPRMLLGASPISFYAQSVAPGAAVKSVNGVTEKVTIQGGDNVTVTENNGILTIDAEAGGEAFAFPYEGTNETRQPALRITSGLGAGIEVESGNNKRAISATIPLGNTGTAGYFAHLNAADPSFALDAFSISNGGVARFHHIGAEGYAGLFRSTGTQNNFPALVAEKQNLDINSDGFFNDALIARGDAPMIGVYSRFQANTHSGLVLAGVDNGNVVDKWGITREFFAGNGLKFTYGLNDDPAQNTVVMSLSSTGITVPNTLSARFLAGVSDLGSSATPMAGGVYKDNVVYAWAHVNADGSVASSYGCTVTKQNGFGRYRITFNRQLPNGASAVVTVQTLNDPVIATAVTNAAQADVSTKVFNGAAFVAADYGFYIQVVGRP